MLLPRLIYESFWSAVNSLKVNKLRTLLSLLGITIGIFAIISVFTVIDSLERYIRNSLNSLGSNMVYIQKWPWTPPEGETEYPWWKYINRPAPKEEESEELLKRSRLIEDGVFFLGFNRKIQHGNINMEDGQILATTYPLMDVWNLKISQGRYFTMSEMASSVPLTVIGDEIASQLFEGISPLGKTVKFQGFTFTIIGVYEKTGQDMFGTSMDKRLHIPVGISYSMVDSRNRDMGQAICLKSKPGTDPDEFAASVQAIMRSVRRLKPMEENNFAVNKVDFIATRFDAFFKVFNMAGWIIGGFSILVGGFGIANIMFVSVKERTKIIGIQKSLGAKRFFILLEFIFEAIILSIIGGMVGLILIFTGTLIFNYFSEMSIHLTMGNIILGIMISSVIGFLAGLMPARSAARLDPVVAMNSV
jgi:putative ABC transport system permease protein